MRNGQNNNKRMRNRNNNNNNNNNNNRRGQNPMTRVFESNGPDIKIRGTASHVAEKYVQLARDARSSGDPVAAENYYQHAEHYFRLIAAAQEQFRQNQPQPRTENEMPAEDGDDESESFSNFGQEPGFVPAQPQPFVPRDNNQRDHQREGQPYQPREQHQAREHNANRDHRPQPQFQPQPQPQPVIADSVSVDRLPSFITGPQPQINSGPAGFEGNGGERFPPRRRRRPHGPRPDGVPAPVVPGDDFNPGNE
jgi:Domain of unknown function (DUF4167)